LPPTSFSGRASWTIDTESLRVTIFQSGGHLAEFILKASEVNPLWSQSIPTIDPDTYDPRIHGGLYGTTSESRLLSGLAGHNLCFPFWGNPSESESAAGMTYHGESGIRRWQVLEDRPGELTIEVTLPQSATRMRRQFRARGHAMHCIAEATNLAAWDRPFGWCEHVTMGPPFVESGSIHFDASADKGFVTGHQSGLTFHWPEGAGAGAQHPNFDLSSFANTRHEDLVNSFLADSNREWAFFTAFNRTLSLLFGYVYPTADFPWLNVWESNTENRQTRGMEFSNTPHHGTMKTLVSASHIWNAPAYEWLDALSTVRKQFIAFSHRVPSDYRGTADIQVRPDAIEVSEHSTGRVFQVPA
jgi:hypothetical protein